MLTGKTSAWRQKGLSLVELLIGVTVGLFVVAAAGMLLSTHLTENRRLLLETQLQQDLRATADIISREIRRAGYWATAQDGVWRPTLPEPSVNPFRNLIVTAGTQGAIEYDYKRPDNATGPFKYRVHNGIIKTQLASTTAEQDLTDSRVLYVDSVEITQTTSDTVRLSCPKACPVPATPPVAPATTIDYCWPLFGVSEFVVTITGHSVSDSSIERSVTSRVRLRNDQVQYDAVSGVVCPS